LQKAIQLLASGNCVAIPTETVYGLAANALNTDAVAKIFQLKNRPQTNPLIVHCGSIEQVERYVSEFPPLAMKLAKKFWPGPLTLLLPKNDKIPDQITAGSNRVGVRIPNHSLTLKLLQKVDFPLAAPSANKYGSVSPTCAQHVKIQFENAPFILDGGPCSVGIESTIVGLEEASRKLYAAFYQLDKLNLEEIYMKQFPNKGIGKSLNDRIQRAGMKS